MKLNLMDRNYLMESLTEEKPVLPLVAQMFCELAKDKWRDEDLQVTVKHGYSHICGIFETLDKLMGASVESWKSFDADFRCLLASSIYAHDLGMVAYYDIMFSEFGEINSLTAREEYQVRKAHATIIDKKLTSLDSQAKVRSFFGPIVMSSVKQLVAEGDRAVLTEALQYVVDNHRKLAVICQFHNERLSRLRSVFATLVDSGDLPESETELDHLRRCIALLQFADALDMSKRRINELRFRHLLQQLEEDIHPKHGVRFAFEDLELLGKMFMCYLIDEVHLMRDNNLVNIDFELTLRQGDITGHQKEIAECLKKYQDRLRREGLNCARMIEDKMGLKIVMPGLDKPPVHNPEKEPVGPRLFDWLGKKSYKSMDDFLRECLVRLKGKSEFSYLKLYSAAACVFFDGISKGVEDEKQRNAIENYCYFRSDWKIPEHPSFFVINKDQMANFAKRKGVYMAYGDYVDLINQSNIGYEAYYGFGDGRNHFIGLVNLHYQGELDDNQVGDLQASLDKDLGTLGVELSRFHYSVDVPNTKSDIKNFNLLSKSVRDELMTLYENRFNSDYDFTGLCLAHSVAETAQLFRCSPGSNKADRRFIVLNQRVLTEVLDSTVRQARLSYYLSTEVGMSFDERSRSCVFHITMNLKSEGFKDILIRAYSFFRAMDNRGLDEDLVLRRYLIPLKVCITSIGGRIDAQLNNDNMRLVLFIVLPQQTAADLRVSGIGIAQPG